MPRPRSNGGAKITGWVVGAAYMPPAQPPGYYDTTGKLHGTVKTVPYKPAGNAEPSRDCAAIKIHRAVGAGHAPPATVYYNEYNRLGCRHGYYAARCSQPINATYRANRTGRIYASPTNLPEMGGFAAIANFLGGVGSPRPTGQ